MDLFGRKTIDSFTGEHAFLSNFYQVYFIHDGQMWKSSEHAYQAAKCARREDWEKFTDPKLTAGQAKRLGRQVEMRSDWEQIKITVMRDILRSKFKDRAVRHALLETGDAILIEGNTWGDEFWGMCNGKGMNVLGRLLEELRTALRREEMSVPEDFFTHKHSWRQAIEFALKVAKDVEPDDVSYWEHELKAFDRAYAELESQL